MSEDYVTISKATSYELVIKKSRFICSLTRIQNEEEARAFIASVKKANRKANHNCFAYQLGANDQVQRESDDGEPSGTAGVPILEALKLAKLHDVCAVVTRYFGGIKLGAGGLIRAYSNTTSDAIHQAGRVRRVLQAALTITIPYRLNDQVHYYLAQAGLSPQQEDYGTAVTTTVFVDQAEMQQRLAELTDRFNGQLTLTHGEERFREVPIEPP